MVGTGLLTIINFIQSNLLHRKGLNYLVIKVEGSTYEIFRPNYMYYLDLSYATIKLS